MVDRPLEHSIAYTFHLEGKNILTRTRYRQRAIKLGEALDTLMAWREFQVDERAKNERVKTYFSENSWDTIFKGLKVDIETLNRLAQEGE